MPGCLNAVNHLSGNAARVICVLIDSPKIIH